MRAFLLCTAAIVVLFAVPARAGFYKWVDKDGKENYTNELSKVPEEYRDQTVTVEPRDDRVSIGGRPTAPPTSGAAGAHKDQNGKGEQYWRMKAEGLRRQLADLQDEYAIVLKQEQEREEKLKAQGKPLKKATTNKKKLQLEKKIAQVKRRLDVELPEDARKAGAYPGWIRE
jgi:hypothetical protein